MKIKITTYVDEEKLLEESYIGEYFNQKEYEKIEYYDKNNKKIKIFIDKIKESVSIEKDDFKIDITYIVKKSNYKTEMGIVNLAMQLIKIKKKERNNLVFFEISYNIIFNPDNKQKNTLKILLKRN
ncbi:MULTISPECIES: hypothetical protein [Gemella]|uniref:hypothetical protein n=1 Tax=Gemella TaxID=1378 RepID=UPI0007681B59|nr:MULTISPECIES: hypothetical protein [Gemella]AME09020.1 hypothetical protein AXE85_02000 [Gemella sp. oral taxon 928]AXI26590.1 hypothetical protein CG018_03770 [Gemella sp. ND 6198]